MMQIHPSVIMSISEHHTRVRAAGRQQQEIVIGALLGKRTDHNIEVVDSFELSILKNDSDATSGSGPLIFDREFTQRKLPLVEQVSKDLTLIGWYSTVPPVADQSFEQTYISLHKEISEFISNPILLKLNPYKRERDPKISGTLPLNVYEPVISIDTSGEVLKFIEVPWTIVTEDVEIIGLEHNAKMTHVNVTPSAAIDNLKLQASAVKMLKDRIKVISKFVKDVQSGALEYYAEPLKDINNLTKRFPLMNSEQYNQAYNVQCNDVALNTYLGILTKGSMCKMDFSWRVSKSRAFSSTHARR